MKKVQCGAPHFVSSTLEGYHFGVSRLSSIFLSPSKYTMLDFLSTPLILQRYPIGADLDND